MHAAIDAAREAVSRNKIRTKEIKEIKVGVSKSLYERFGALNDQRVKPTTITDAQFSLPYVVVAVIVDGKLDLDSFTDKAIKRNDVLQLMKKVKTEIDPDIEKASPRYPPVPSPARVVIKTKNGKTYEKRVDFAKGSPKNPMTAEELRAKFYYCASYAARPLPKENLRKAVRLVEKLEAVDDVAMIINYLT